MEYVFDPRVYGEISLRNRCMGSEYDDYPREGDEAQPFFHSTDINRAFYKTADNH